MNCFGKITAQHVAEYLRQHPDFFNQHLDLLEILTVSPPTCGNVVSLAAKQLDIFRAKQQKLEQQLDSLIEIAKDNDLYATRLHQLTLVLLNSATLEAAIANLNTILKQGFKVDFLSLKIIQENKNPALTDFFISPEDEFLDYVAAEVIHKMPRCGCLSVEQSRFLFGGSAEKIKSYAIIPLLHADFAGLLVIGSVDENRFHQSLGTLFLTQLGEIISLRLASLLST